MTIDGQATPAAATAAEPGRPGRLRTTLLIVVGFLVALGAVAGGALLFLYDRATAIDRSNPEGVAVQFLDAVLVAKDANRVRLYTCDSWPADQAMSLARPSFEDDVSSTWNDLNAIADGRRATVTVNVQFVSASPRVRYSERWTMDLVNEGGWRVCGLDKESSLDP